MSLGFARDSVHDLANLGADAEPSKSTLGETPQEVGQDSVVVLDVEADLEGDGDDDDDEKDNNNIDDDNTDASSISKATTVESSSAPTKSEIATPATTNAGQYAGFTADYSDYEQYGGVTYADPYAQAAVLLGEQQQRKGGSNFFCCMFPWIGAKPPPKIEDEKDEDESPPLPGDLTGAVAAADDNKSDDEVSTGSGAFGEKLTENERAAVMARLRLASPEIITEPTPVASTPADKVSSSSAGAGNLEYESGEEESKEEPEEEQQPKKKPLKPILRHSLSKKPVDKTLLKNATSSDSTSGEQQQQQPKRRSLFPQQYEAKPKNNKSVRFAPMARVVTVKSKNLMTELEKSRIWFQKRDYDDFKKTGRMIARAMCEGGSEIWLATNDAWQKKASATASSGGRVAIHSHDRNEIDTAAARNRNNTSVGDKWWHKFGHSRRGLEHIASVEEGRQRQQNVRTAIRVVIDEQRRQKIYRKEDDEKLRMLALQYTTWARDLALAAAASDAEAVAVDFDENRKSREFYILKHARAQGGFSKQLPLFMMPAGRSPQVLDQHTSTQIRYRRNNQKAKVAPSPSTTKDNVGKSLNGGEQPISDTPSRPKMAKKAAGFGTEEADVSAILSGMGAVKKVGMSSAMPQPTSVGAH